MTRAGHETWYLTEVNLFSKLEMQTAHNSQQPTKKMKYFTFYLLGLLVACTSAFAPIANKPATVTQLAANKAPEPISENKNAAAFAAFATAVAPLAAQAKGGKAAAAAAAAVVATPTVQAAGGIDEGVIIGYAAGLVACVVSLAVGFAIGYGTLVKP